MILSREKVIFFTKGKDNDELRITSYGEVSESATIAHRNITDVALQRFGVKYP